MKKINLLLAFVLLTIITKGQTDITLCHTSPTEKFALFASNKDFNSQHAAPRPFTYLSQEGGKMIKIKCSDGIEANGYFIPAKTKTNNWVFVFQEWWGLNDYIKKQSEELYKDLGNVNVLALDMYDGKVAADRENAGKYMQEFKQDRGNTIVQGALAYAGKDAKVATIGWCFGGGQSIQAALTGGKQTVACVMYYGMPEDNVDRLKTLNCDVLMMWATQDQYINKAVVDKFETNMKTAGKKLTVKPYDAAHGFANPSNARGYNDDATKDAYKNTLEFLAVRLK